MIRVVLWDVDNTLLNFPAAERQALRDGFVKFDLGPCDDDRVNRYASINQSWWKRLENGEVTKAQLLPGRFQEFFASEGIDFTRWDEFNASYQVQLGETVVFIDNGYETVRDLKGIVKQYAVTNGTKVAQDRKLKNSGLIDLFDGVFISEQVGAEKPSQAYFNAVFQAIGPYEKDEILIVGDSLTSDMRGGSWAGIQCCWYNPAGAPVPDELNITYDIRNLDEVRAIVAGER